MAKRSKKKKAQPQVVSSKPMRPPQPVEIEEIFPAKPKSIPGKVLLQVSVIVVAALWIYWPALRGDWLWDDDFYLTANPLLHDPNRWWRAWLEPGSFLEYYPLEQSLQWLQWQLWGHDTLGYHLTNVALHVISALLVWRLLGKFGLPLAWLGGLLFVIHPVQVESVAWIAEFKNTLSLPPFLLAMIFWIDYEEHKRPRDYRWSLGLFLVAMLGKISMAAFPVVILLYAWWKRRRIDGNDLKASAPFFAVSLVLGTIALMAGRIGYWQSDHPSPELGPGGGILGRLVLAGQEIAFYFSKVAWPVDLLPVYPKWAVEPLSPVPYLCWLVMGAVIYYLLRQRHGWGRHALLGVGFFLISLTPCPGFIPAPNMGFAWVMDHFLYIPIIGMIGLVVAGLGQMDLRVASSARPFLWGIIAVVIAVLAWGSHLYAAEFVNQTTLWTYTLQRNPDAEPAHSNLGLTLIQEGRASEGMEQIEQALRINPDDAQAYNNLGTALFQTGQIAEATQQYQRALEHKPNYAEAFYGLGRVALQAGRFPEAMDRFERALQIDPYYAEAHNNLGYALANSGRVSDAVEEYQEALRINPDLAEAHYNLGNSLAQAGQFSEAIQEFQQAIVDKPDYAEAYNNLGTALVRTGRLAQAITQLEQAVRIKPDYALARDNLKQLQSLPPPTSRGR